MDGSLSLSLSLPVADAQVEEEVLAGGVPWSDGAQAMGHRRWGMEDGSRQRAPPALGQRVSHGCFGKLDVEAFPDEPWRCVKVGTSSYLTTK